MADDWPLIYASFQSQYGIRLGESLDDMSWREFSYLISGLSGDSPLGNIIAIRAEDDPERLKEFTPDQRRVRNEYRQKKAKKMEPRKAEDALEKIKQAFIGLAKHEET